MSEKTKKILNGVLIGIVCLGLFWAGLLLLGGHYKCNYKTQTCSYVPFAWHYQRKSKCKSYCNYKDRECDPICFTMAGKPGTCTDQYTNVTGSCCKINPGLCSGCDVCMEECVTPC